MERKLASVQRVDSIEAIEGADRIELVHILGWQCVAKKGEFKPGDLCVYYEVDSYLPLDDPRYEFLKKGSLRTNEYMGPGILIKTRKFRGKYSQGLALPLSEFKEVVNPKVGDDLTGLLRVRKWYVPEVKGDMGTFDGYRPGYVRKTDETRIQSMPDLIDRLKGKPYYISTKMDGTSMSVWCFNGEVGVSGRNRRFADDGTSPMWEKVKSLGLDDNLRRLYGDGESNIIIQGEFCGPKIQGNRLTLMDYEWYIFNIFINGKLLCLEDMKDVCTAFGLTTVPIEEVGDHFDYDLAGLLTRAEGKYPNGHAKEGIVIRPVDPEYSDELDKELSFKVINNRYLLK